MFKKADSSVFETFIELVEKTFPELSGYSFGLLFREKIKKSRGHITLAEICLPGKLLSYYARNENGQPYDFIIVADEMAWAVARESDRVRIMRHELRHVHIDEKGKPRLVGHDFEDFHEEVKLNADQPDWCSRLVGITQAGYDQVKDGGKDPRVERAGVLNDDLEPGKPRQVKIEAAQQKAQVHEFSSKVAKTATDRLEDMAKKRGLK